MGGYDHFLIDFFDYIQRQVSYMKQISVLNVSNDCLTHEFLEENFKKIRRC